MAEIGEHWPKCFEFASRMIVNIVAYLFSLPKGIDVAFSLSKHISMINHLFVVLAGLEQDLAARARLGGVLPSLVVGVCARVQKGILLANVYHIRADLVIIIIGGGLWNLI